MFDPLLFKQCMSDNSDFNNVKSEVTQMTKLKKTQSKPIDKKIK